MGICTFHSTNPDAKSAVKELKAGCQAKKPELVIYFASPVYDPFIMAAEISAAFPGSQTIGCTTAGEIISGKMTQHAVVGMAFENEMDQLCIQVVEDIHSAGALNKAFENFSKYFGQPVLSLDVDKYVGIVLMDGLSKAEEEVMDSIGNHSSILFVGGSAGDDLAFKKTFVSANGRSFTNAAILAILKPAHGFSYIKTQSFEKMEKTLTATKVNEKDRTVLEFDHKPAIAAYAEALGKPAENVDHYFMDHPLGLMVENEPYVRSPQQAENGQIVFYCGIMEGMKLNLLKSTDIIKDTHKALQEKEAELGGIRGILNFNCILRTLELQEKHLTDEYGKLFEKIPTIGFSTYGEAYIGHINQTATMLVFR